MKSINNLKNQEKSFTIIELLVVIAVIGLLAGIVLVAISGVRERAQLSRTASWAATNHRVLGADVVLSLDFEECRNVTTTSSFRDASGLGNNATCTRAPCPLCAEGVPGVTGRALEFNNEEGIITVPNTTFLSREVFGTSRNFTLGVWTFSRDWIGATAIISKASSHWFSGEANGIWVTANGFICLMGSNISGDPAGSFVGISSLPPLNQWNHITCIADGTNLRMYINGVRQGSVAIAGLTHSRSENILPLSIGGVCSGCAGRFNGFIDDIRAYSSSVPLSYIQEQYLQGLQSLLANNGITEQEYNQRMVEFNKHNQSLVKE